jgi:transcriptional regulator GlxA family with amidase domain
MHAEPSKQWTVSLAKTAALSRSAYFQRFTRALGKPPMEYLLAWRMALAKDIMDRHDLVIEQVAERVDPLGEYVQYRLYAICGQATK